MMNQDYSHGNEDASKNRSRALIRSLIIDLKSRNGMERQRARTRLVSIGAPAVEQLAELLAQRNAQVRWEAVKALGQIAGPDTAPLFIDALSDEDEEVRWLAAEGLIALGEHAIVPMLETLIDDATSAFIRRGAHHVFKEFSDRTNMTHFYTLLTSLEEQDADLHAPIVAAKILKEWNAKRRSHRGFPKMLN